MNWVMLLTSLLPVVIQGVPSIAAETKQILLDITNSVHAVATSGVLQAQNTTTVLTALAGVIAALKAEPNIPQPILDLIGSLDRAAQAALAADAAAQKLVDPTVLQPIQPVA